MIPLALSGTQMAAHLLVRLGTPLQYQHQYGQCSRTMFTPVSPGCRLNLTINTGNVIEMNRNMVQAPPGLKRHPEMKTKMRNENYSTADRSICGAAPIHSSSWLATIQTM